MFTAHTGAIVIEFYPYQNISNNRNWRITGLLGWTSILLDSRLLTALTSTMGTDGMRTEGLMIHSDGDLAAENSKYLTAEILLRIITERHPTKNLLLSPNPNMPVLPSYFNASAQQNGVEPLYVQASVPKKSFLPSIQPSSASSAPPPPPPPPPAPAIPHVDPSAAHMGLMVCV